MSFILVIMHLCLQASYIKRLQVLLILGAAGGVGLSVIQIGKICGATVIAVVRCVCFLYLNSISIYAAYNFQQFVH